MVAEANDFKEKMDDLYGKIKSKNKEIAQLKIGMDDVNHQIIEKDKEIS